MNTLPLPPAVSSPHKPFSLPNFEYVPQLAKRGSPQ